MATQDEETTAKRQKPSRKETALSLRGRILRTALQDVLFRDELLADSNKAVGKRFGEVGWNVSVYQEKPREFALLIPHPAPDVCRQVEMVEKGFRLFQGEAPTRSQLEAIMLNKAFDDAGYRRRLESTSLEVLNEELEDFGGPLPPDVRVTTFTERPDECLVILPSPIVSEEFTVEELTAAVSAVFPITAIVAFKGGAVVAGTVSGVVGGIVSSKTSILEGRRDDEVD